MIIIGAGVAGLMAALEIAPSPVTVLSAGQPASELAQGGLAAAMGADDSVALHIADTLAAGAGLSEPDAVARIVGAGPGLLARLREWGARFDPTPGLEAAHSRRRIHHARGDATGAEIMRALLARAAATPGITLRPLTAMRLVLDEGGICGVATPEGVLASDRVLLASGGIGALFSATTNPGTAIGHGLMLAMEAGATLKNLEFIQFHPTALDVPGRVTLPLISEAVRGEGARFIDETGRRFMDGGDLATRDVVARAVSAHRGAGHSVFLDARGIGDFAARFPAIARLCAEAGVNPALQPIPVRPAAHYHMGGLAVDAAGRTSLPGLYAAGEVACTGLHGANRLASNSLLEAAVCGAVAGRAMLAQTSRRLRLPAAPLPLMPDAAPVRPLMSAHLGVLRDAAGLRAALAGFAALGDNPAARLAARIAQAALDRPLSIGAHCRTDSPPSAGEAA